MNSFFMTSPLRITSSWSVDDNELPATHLITGLESESIHAIREVDQVDTGYRLKDKKVVRLR